MREKLLRQFSLAKKQLNQVEKVEDKAEKDKKKTKKVEEIMKKQLILRVQIRDDYNCQDWEKNVEQEKKVEKASNLKEDTWCDVYSNKIKKSNRLV